MIKLILIIAILIAAGLAGLIPDRVEASENDFPNNSSSIPIERILESIRNEVPSLGGGFIKMDQPYLQPYEIDKTIFESDDKI